jgi:hypothetical protein
MNAAGMSYRGQEIETGAMSSPLSKESTNERRPERTPFVFPLCAAGGYYDAAASCLIAPDIMRTRAASLAPLT